MALQYTEELPANSMHIENPKRGSPAEIDSYFLPHLTWAMTWLFVGFIQIYQAKDGWSVSDHMISMAFDDMHDTH